MLKKRKKNKEKKGVALPAKGLNIQMIIICHCTHIGFYIEKKKNIFISLKINTKRKFP